MTGATAAGPIPRTMVRGASAPSRAKRIPLGSCLAVALTGAYFARASLLAYVGSQWTIQFVSQVSIAALVAACVYVVAGGLGRLQWCGVCFILAGGASLWHCETLDFSLTRWAGWAMMLLAVGPIIGTPLARNFRRSAMDVLSAALVVVTLVSAGWWLAGLPNLGRGDFTGVMWHSMTLGPIAALAGLTALTRAMSRGSLAWYGVFAAAAGVATLAASRSALAGLVLGVMILVAMKLKRRPFLSAAVLVVGVVVAVAPEASLSFLSGVLPENFTAGLMRKSWDHTREAHWDARWEEFLYAPLTGVGFASGWEDTAGYNEESGAIETGSSYLSILSMTGVLGASAFGWLVASAVHGAIKLWRRIDERQKTEFACFAGFWLVHLGAEGYVYGVGSLLGLTFWLWMGRLRDQLDAAATPSPLRVGVNSRSPLAPVDFSCGGPAV